MIDGAELGGEADAVEFEETGQSIVATEVVLLPVKVLLDGRELEPVDHVRLRRDLNLVDDLRLAGPPEEGRQQLRQRCHVALFQRRLQIDDERAPLAVPFDVQEGEKAVQVQHRLESIVIIFIHC